MREIFKSAMMMTGKLIKNETANGLERDWEMSLHAREAGEKGQTLSTINVMAIRGFD